VSAAELELPDWAESLWRKDARHIALWGGRAGAKSRSIATALVLQAADEHHRWLCCREIQNSIKGSVKQLLDDAIDRCGLGNLYESTEREIRGPHDSLFIFAGLRGNATGVRSLEGLTGAWIEEAQTVSQASIDTLEPTIRVPGSRLIWSWNPDLESDPVDAMFRGRNDPEQWPGPPPRSVVLNVNYEQNPWFPPDLREKMEWDRARDIDKYNHIWLGQYRRNSEARVFKNWRVEAFESPSNVEYRLGADFGFSIDPSCALRCWIDGTQIFVDYEAWGLQVEIINLPRLFQSIPEAERYWMTADSSRPETISHLRNNGFPRIQSAIKGKRSLEEGVEFLKSYDLVIHPRCERLIAELTLYSYKADNLTGQVTAALEDKDNHMIDALRYAVEGARRALAMKRPEPGPVHIPTLIRSTRQRIPGLAQRSR
jgi:phage terminase large subunit